MRKIIILNLLISVVNGNLPKKIIGGQTVQIEKYSYQVSIQYQNYHICGGSIISYHHILTAASCVSSDRNVYYANIEILSGTNDLMRQTIGWNINKVSRILLHEDYDPLNYWINDIGIMIFKQLIFNII
ncbi:hypothetical protein HCN44_002236 [Aphidius gifuensis]|uniref:Peptidase S1 domain-containing protein n=1 Tax=Aphidius gifuensis TaxID=684658 RepID=A0A835CXH9_APHGI|nr:hypothetical protein HCN44_002236 [Aphidius gifuensis]